jgi:hypothetical protein
MRGSLFLKAAIAWSWMSVGLFAAAPALTPANEPAKGPETVARPPTPIFVWQGHSEVGFLRVELWNRPPSERPFTQDLVVRSTTYEGSISYNGLMLQIPAEIKTEPVIGQIFSRSPGDIEAHGFHEFSILATLSPDGTLRLYGYANNWFVHPCELHPSI